MTIINKEILKKYALNYIEKYNSSKKNLKYVLLRKVKKNIINNNENIKKYELDIIEIIKELEDQKIINDDVLVKEVQEMLNSIESLVNDVKPD